MLRRNRLRPAVRAALGITSLAFLMPGESAAKEDSILEEVHVTGTRIVRANMVSSSPIAQVNSEDLLLGGITRAEDLLKNLPQVYPGQSSTVSGGATGTATLDLRGLGPSRTLVLIDGRRLPTGSPLTAGAADINQVPGVLIRSVEVLTGGASAAYGSDALAGVVNFFLIDDFEGVKLDYQYSQYAHDNDNSGMAEILRQSDYPVPSGTDRDGDTSDLAFIIGGNIAGGRGNVTAYATYRDIDAVLQSDRIHSACALLPVVGNPSQHNCGGSSTLPEGRFTDFGVLPATGQGASFDYKVEGDQFVPTGNTRYNYAPLNYFQRPDERYTAGALGHYDINEHIEVYTQLMFMDDRTVSQIAPSGSFFTTNSLSCGNPFLSEQQFDLLCASYGLGPEDEQLVYIGRRNAEGGPRRHDLRHTSFRGVFGLRGDIDETWRYDLYGQYAEVDQKETYFNDVLTSRIVRSLDVTTDPATGEPVCVATLNGTDPDCVPWNIFSEGGVTQEATDYFSVPLFARGTTDQTVISGYVAGYLEKYGIRSPLAETGVDIILGVEYREENLQYNPDKNYQSGDASGQGGPKPVLDGGFDVTEVYAELSIPLVEGKTMAESLILDLGYRYSDYSTNETTDTYKVAGSWAPIEDFRLRASFQHAVRVPNIDELFSPQDQGFAPIPGEDPCAGTDPVRSLADCAHTGVTAAQYGTIPFSPNGGYNGLFGGNPELEPEESDTRSIGFLYWPRFVDGLSISLDWFNIEIDDAIEVVEIATTLDRCLDTGDPVFCDRIRRNPGLGDLWIRGGDGIIDATNLNMGFLETEGYDLIVDYSFDVGRWGTMSIHNNLTYLDKWDIEELPGSGVRSCKSNYILGCPRANLVIETRNSMRVSWITPWDLTLSALWRYIGSLESDDNFHQGIGSKNYFDVAMLWDITDSASLRAGINNVFDKEPARFSFFGNGNTYPGQYDALGQYWFAGLTVAF